MIIRCKEHRRWVFPDLYLCGANSMSVQLEVMYLGHFFTGDDKDISRHSTVS